MIRNATTLRLALAAIALVAWAGTSLAQVTSEPLGTFAGYTTYDRVTQTSQFEPVAPAVTAATVIYDNSSSTALFGFTSTDLLAVWGDELFTTGLGTLSSMKLTIFNSGSSAGPLLTAVVGVSFYDGSTFAPLGGFTANFNFGTGLAAGFYTVGSITGLDPLLIDLNTTDVIVTQTIVSKTGAASRMGVVSLDPPSVGSSGADMYISATTIGPAGWYTSGSGNANPGYQVAVTSAPVPTSKSTWGRVKNLYR